MYIQIITAAHQRGQPLTRQAAHCSTKRIKHGGVPCEVLEVDIGSPVQFISCDRGGGRGRGRGGDGRGRGRGRGRK